MMFLVSIMYPYTANIEISNSRTAPLVVAVEPWANDYTLLPGEELKVVAFGESAMPSFHVREWDDTTQVYCEGTDDFNVLHEVLPI